MDEIPVGFLGGDTVSARVVASGPATWVGYEFFDVYAVNVRRVTPADVQRVAKQYLGVLRMIIVQPP
jgi:hypothetical protein